MKFFLILLCAITSLYASDLDDDQELTDQSPLPIDHPSLTVDQSDLPIDISNLPPERLLKPSPDYLGTEYVVLLPVINCWSTWELFNAYNCPARMYSQQTDETVQNPFSLNTLAFTSGYPVWGFISRGGLWGHIRIDVTTSNKAILICIIGYTEDVKRTPLVQEAVRVLTSSELYCRNRWSTNVYQGNYYLRRRLEKAGFAISSTSIMLTYERPPETSIANIEE